MTSRPRRADPSHIRACPIPLRPQHVGPIRQVSPFMPRLLASSTTPARSAPTHRNKPRDPGTNFWPSTNIKPVLMTFSLIDANLEHHYHHKQIEGEESVKVVVTLFARSSLQCSVRCIRALHRVPHEGDWEVPGHNWWSARPLFLTGIRSSSWGRYSSWAELSTSRFRVSLPS